MAISIGLPPSFASGVKHSALTGYIVASRTENASQRRISDGLFTCCTTTALSLLSDTHIPTFTCIIFLRCIAM